jgi:hypothetical protein
MNGWNIRRRAGFYLAPIESLAGAVGVEFLCKCIAAK